MDIAIPSQLQVVDGRIISRTPIYSKGHLTSFRFCIDSPRLTFTYSDDEPKFQDAWGAISSTDNVKVVYADHRKRNPTLWGLAVNGNQLTNSAELHRARLRHALLYLAGCLLSFGYAFWAWQTPKESGSAA
jgi:hypothetical protein